MALERVPADIRAQGGVARMVCFRRSSFLSNDSLAGRWVERPPNDQRDRRCRYYPRYG